MLSTFLRFLLVLVACWSIRPARAADEPPDDFDKWNKAIAAFEKADKQSPPPRGGVLFVGSSSIRLWDLSASFPGVPVINRGFGGSHMADTVHFANRIIFPHRPRVVVVYAGDNDIKAGKSPQRVFRDYRRLVNLIRVRLPKTRVVYIAIKPSLARWSLIKPMRDANRRIDAYSRTDVRLDYVDLESGMIGKDRKPRKDLFVKDGLHLNSKGYELWTKLVKPMIELPEPDELRSVFEAHQFQGEGGELPFRLMSPTQLEPEKEYPLVVFLHGAGERGDDNQKQLIHGMAQFASPSVRERFPCFVAAPQCPDGSQWVNAPWDQAKHTMPAEPSTAMQNVFGMIEELQRNLPIDSRRIYVTGLSMGGFGAWDAISRRPNLFAAAAPVCGGADMKLAEKMRDVPVWAFHGARDGVVTPQLSRDIVKALRDAGAKPKYTEYPDVQHNSWTNAYSTVALYEWMFEQRLR